MRIVLVNVYAQVTGGADLHCLEITEGLRARGHDVAWLSTRSDRNLEEQGAFVGLMVGSETRDQLTAAGKGRVAGRAMWNRSAAGAMVALAQRFRPDVTHFHKSYVQLSVAPAVVAKRHGLPVVQTVHDYEFLSASSLDSSGGSWDRDESRASYRLLNSATGVVRRRVHRPLVDRWISVSRAVADLHRSIGGIESVVIPNFTSSAGSDLPGPEDRDGVVFIGRLSSEKGIEFVIEAARSLPRVGFTVAGDGPLAPLVRQASGALENLAFEGFVGRERARELLRSSSVCLMPSVWQEPGPLACLEAMAEGTPVVCFDNGGLAEYVSDSSAGIVCDIASTDALCGAISRLTDDPVLWAERSANGIEGTRVRHTRDAYLDRLESVYESAIGERRVDR